MIPIDSARLEANWRAITFELDAPRPGRLERVLRWLRIPSDIGRVMAATPALRRSWFGALVLVVVVGLGAIDANQPEEGLFTLLFLAPLVPAIGVGLAYGPAVDPAHEIGLATPMRGVRLLLTRAAVVHVVASVVLGAASALAAGRASVAFAWWLPSIGLTAVTLGLMTVLSPRRATAVAAIGWTAAVALGAAIADDRLGAFGAVGQTASVVAAIVGLAGVHLGRQRLDTWQAPA